MGYHIELNSLLVVPNKLLDLNSMKVGNGYTLPKDGERLYPLNIPLDICDEDYQYYGKIIIRKLILESSKTTVEFELLKIYSAEEAKIYTNNFIK